MSTAMMQTPATSRAPVVSESNTDRLAAQLEKQRAADVAFYREMLAASHSGRKTPAAEIEKLGETMRRLGVTMPDFKADLAAVSEHAIVKARAEAAAAEVKTLLADEERLKAEVARLEQELHAARTRLNVTQHRLPYAASESHDVPRFEARHPRVFASVFPPPDTRGPVVGRVAVSDDRGARMHALHADGSIGAEVQ